ncbi:MAG TPA: aminopeptidase P N-terminal domain-containing protein [Candidatus Babeliales bacterium]|nr:aminopeptidase P N-terminal domain-containing protein [Candidatus Babeliales bacterium]
MKQTGPQPQFLIQTTRRKELLTAIKQQHGAAKGIVVLFADFEVERLVFRQESSFYYLTGIKEPGVALVMELDGAIDLYIPNCDKERAKWMATAMPLTQENAVNMGLNSITHLGSVCPGYQFHPFFPKQEYSHLIARIEQVIAAGGKLFTLSPNTPNQYIQQRLILERLKGFMHLREENIIDISPLVAAMRRKKDMSEIERLYKAIDTTILAQEAAAQAIGDGVLECEVQAALEYMFTGSGARPAFPSIVGSGKNSTVLHYHDNNTPLKNGDLVVVDIGAEQDYYCADLTRTFPVSGTFTKRQKELYNLVLETQEYVASLAKPGMWLSNKDYPEQSLNHLARKFLKERGYEQYFLHGIGHFLGLDVHDVGDYGKPLQEGDIITIEPGIYIAQERIGIRIEDDYWIVKDGVINLSEALPKKAEDIEAMVQQTFVYPDEQEDDVDEEFDDQEYDD